MLLHPKRDTDELKRHSTNFLVDPLKDLLNLNIWSFQLQYQQYQYQDALKKPS